MSTIARRLSTTALTLSLAVSGLAPGVAAEPVLQPGTTVAPAGPVPATSGPSTDHAPAFWCLIFRCWP